MFRIEGLVDGPVDPIERHDKREEEEEEVRIGQTEVALFPRFLLRLSAFLTRILSPLRIFSRFRDSCAPAPLRIFFFFFFFLLFLLFRLPIPLASYLFFRHPLLFVPLQRGQRREADEENIRRGRWRILPRILSYKLSFRRRNGGNFHAIARRKRNENRDKMNFFLR